MASADSNNSACWVDRPHRVVRSRGACQPVWRHFAASAKVVVSHPLANVSYSYLNLRFPRESHSHSHSHSHNRKRVGVTSVDYRSGNLLCNVSIRVEMTNSRLS